jgi:GNAT superfamily N-acetyltransferase
MLLSGLPRTYLLGTWVNKEFWYPLVPGSYSRSGEAGVDDMIIRSAQSEDVEALANLMTELGYPTSSEDMHRRFEAIRTDPSYATLVAERGGEVLGMVGLHFERYYQSDDSRARIRAFVVGSEHRGRGVGRTLLSVAEDWARQRGARDVMLTTHKRRTDAHRFYLSMGYEATGYRFYKSLGDAER